MEKISGIVLTDGKNPDLDSVLSDLFFCHEVIIVSDNFLKDSSSIPAIIQKAKNSEKQKFKLYSRNLNGDFASQRNFAMSKASGDWIFFVDDDERVEKSLADEIINEINSAKKIAGFLVKRKDKFLGKWLECGETSGIRLLRIGRRGMGEWKGKVHERWEIKGRKKLLSNSLLHYPHKNISEFLDKINMYTDIAASEKYAKKEKASYFSVFSYPFGKFMVNYIYKKGFRDGTAGFIHAALMSLHSFLVRSKMYIRQISV